MDYIPVHSQESVYHLNSDFNWKMKIPLMQPLKEYDRSSDWHQYQSEAKAYAEINNWDDRMLKSQLLMGMRRVASLLATNNHKVLLDELIQQLDFLLASKSREQH